LAILTALAACGGQVGDDHTTDAALDSSPSDGIVGEVGKDSGLPHPPSKHRAAPATCTTPALPPEPDFTGHTFGPSAKFECKRHEDCLGINGRCIIVDTDPPYDPGGSRCVFSICNKDGDCTGAACECGTVVNTCIGGNCRVDADCASGFCSPSYDQCLGTLLGYYCHAPVDECVDDSDCDTTTFRYHCLFDTSLGHWTCPRAACGA
jgi:hypothetical protein